MYVLTIFMKYLLIELNLTGIATEFLFEKGGYFSVDPWILKKSRLWLAALVSQLRFKCKLVRSDENSDSN